MNKDHFEKDSWHEKPPTRIGYYSVCAMKEGNLKTEHSIVVKVYRKKNQLRIIMFPDEFGFHDEPLSHFISSVCGYNKIRVFWSRIDFDLSRVVFGKESDETNCS